jgi:hypothetical protein
VEKFDRGNGDYGVRTSLRLFGPLPSPPNLRLCESSLFVRHGSPDALEAILTTFFPRPEINTGRSESCSSIHPFGAPNLISHTTRLSASVDLFEGRVTVTHQLENKPDDGTAYDLGRCYTYPECHRLI